MLAPMRSERRPRDGRVASNVGDLLRRRGEGMGGEAESAALARHGLAASDLEAHALFHGESKPGSAFEVTAAAASVCVVIVPGGPMAPDAQDPPTDLLGGDRACHVPRGEGARRPSLRPFSTCA